jgi:cysteinyl-tRNA synthetase
MANYWVHNGFLQVEGEKMAKSLGNFVTIRDLLRDWPGEVLRLAMLQTHYRQPLNWTINGLREAQRILDHWYELVGDAPAGLLCADVLAALADDLNTPKAIASLHELRAEAAKGSQPARSSLRTSAQLLALLQRSVAEWSGFRPGSISIDENRVTALIAARNAARKLRNFQESDRIRDELAKMHVVLKDSKDPATGELLTTWEIAR